MISYTKYIFCLSLIFHLLFTIVNGFLVTSQDENHSNSIKSTSSNKDGGPIFHPWFTQEGSKELTATLSGECTKERFPPERGISLDTFVIDLDKPPRERWRSLIESKRTHLKRLLTHVEGLMQKILGQRIFAFINESLPQVAETLPQPYRDEIEGIAEAGGLTLTEATLYNIFYEAFTVCTSIVTQDEQGHILHARNLDFGLFLGWDSKNHTWMVAELLRPLVVRLEWRKSSKVLFESVAYVGYVGVITAQKKGQFSFSLDERFSWNGGFVGLMEWIIFKDRDQKWVSFLVREVMEEANSYNEAVERLSKPRLLAPVYFILSGVRPGEGVVITRYRDTFDLLQLGSSKEGQGSWFLVETNYDHWKKPPFYDDRRTPSIKCLVEAGPKNASLELLYNVLSTRPVLNKLTTYTTLMDTQKGYMETWLRDCPDPCWPW